VTENNDNKIKVLFYLLPPSWIWIFWSK